MELYHSAELATKAEEEFDRIFVDKTLPDEVEEFRLKSENGVTSVSTLLVITKLASSRGDARRLVEQGGVTIDGEKISDFNAPIPSKPEFVLKVGKRRFLKILQ